MISHIVFVYIKGGSGETKILSDNRGRDICGSVDALWKLQ